ncbi:two-component sensor histidine kinase [Sporosarcina sp. NCCP-2716]|uniref:sensor histidine kinase n=1 Tax=Sporosarcina sp. NCCP-2716 TaxID=2943679 RepID=UPI0020419985|nr:HAMP domain-containing sensor histidine kinase [Sporosarcina sp. NCCP-2716]GKV70617.1 two-component sensor histidine kinase [Sporosarcina sp. NCCP-2716]
MRSLYGKFLLYTAGIMAFSALSAFLAVNTYYHQNFKGSNDAKNMAIVQAIASYIEESEPQDLAAYLETQATAGYKLLLVDKESNEQRYGQPFRVSNLPADRVSDVLKGNVYHGMREFPTETFVTGFFSDETANTVGVPLTYGRKQYALFLRPDIKLLFTEVHYLLGGMVIVMAITSLLAMLIVAKRLIRPITQLTLATKKVGKEEFSNILTIDQKDEIGQLAESFRNMTERLGENDLIRKKFISDVSHDFQSPLLNIKGYAGLLLDESLPAEERAGYAKVIQSETDRLSSLTKQLLLLTSLDQMMSPLKPVRYSVSDQLKEAVRKYRWLLEDKQISLSMEIDDAELTGDPAFLEKVWENLLSNALKYTDEYGTIDVSLTAAEASVTVIIRDTGIGIAEENVGQIFNRFYREDDSRTQAAEGTGLGLSIVQQVVELHNGTIAVTSEKGEGTAFTITLPKL